MFLSFKMKAQKYKENVQFTIYNVQRGEGFLRTLCVRRNLQIESKCKVEFVMNNRKEIFNYFCEC